ncbi:unnamed protein product [Nezara viridula]|nr:unnamed protein product [Nezara viridula]
MGDTTEDDRRSGKSEVIVVSDIVVQDSRRHSSSVQRTRSNSACSADLETAITKTGCGKFNIALLLLSFPVSCTSGFDTGSMSFVIPAASVDLGLTYDNVRTRMGLLVGCFRQEETPSMAMWIIPIQVPSEIPFTSWQLFQMACCLPALISGIGCIFFVESPKFLADKGNHEGALKVCQTIYSINTGNLSTTYPIKRLKHTGRKNEKKSNFSKFLDGMDIFRPPFIQKAAIIFIIHLGAVGS